MHPRARTVGLRRDNENRATDRDAQKHEACNHDAAEGEDQVLLLVASEQEAVPGGWRDQADSGARREHQGHEVGGALEGLGAIEADVEGDNEQEREQNLNAGDDDAQLAAEPAEVAIVALGLGFAAAVARQAGRPRTR